MSFREEALQLVIDNDYKTIVEVGVWKGELSRMFYTVADSLTLVDPWSENWNWFSYPVVNGGDTYECRMGEELKTQVELDEIYFDVLLSMPHAKFLRMPSTMAAELIPNESVDFVFIDAIHTYDHCRADILAWLPKIRPGGMIAGDDYVPEHKMVSKAVDELLETQTSRTWRHKIRWNNH